MQTRTRRRLEASAAFHAVLDTPELLENILSCLDSRTLLTSAYRVSRRWRATITGSPVLQRMLFFKAEEFVPQPDGRVERTHNPLLVDAFPPWFIDGGGLHCLNGFSRSKFEDLPMAKSASTLRAFMQPTASWRIMFTSQPPVHKVGCWMSHYPYAGELIDHLNFRFRILRFPHGFRMGKFYHLTQRYLGDISGPYCTINWNPRDPATLANLIRITHVRNTPARDTCAAAVDMIVAGAMSDAWMHPGVCSPGTRKRAAFRKKFTLKNLEGEEIVGPASNDGPENKYKNIVEFAADLDASESASV
ncbi:hypothetical protein BDV95DRAFT_593254 [Massariosphaeria phaeospora]|uniref:F-box domain-containing protein n=1 Tax=Massariosphaeria phaeospora TaxID=100035 RepID=A0A7C8I7W1_9PLEO|nr:hypothetical protein BDV95DRAFT_593254 [Massariosphaeria phaeospora]